MTFYWLKSLQKRSLLTYYKRDRSSRTMNTIKLPAHWKPPKYHIGQRVEQGLIIGVEIYPTDSHLGQQYGSNWRYTVLPNKAEEDVEHLMESEIKSLSPQEIKSEIEAEIQLRQSALAALKNELLNLAA